MFEEIKSPDYKICPVCKSQMAVGLGGYYKHVTPTTRCGYVEKVTDAIFISAIKEQIQENAPQQ